MFFDTIATGGCSHLWLGCDKYWNCVVLAMAMVRSPTTSYWRLSTDSKYSTTRELKRIANQSSKTFVLRKAIEYMPWK